MTPALPSLVSLKQVPDYDPARVLSALRAVMEPLGGMKAFVRPGQKVLLKPNLLGPFAPEKAVTTHPAVVRAAILLVQEAGGEAWVGDSPGMSTVAGAIAGSGLGPVLAETGARVADLGEPAEYEAPQGLVTRHLTLGAPLRQAEVLITLPKLKTHGQMTFTGALKNQYGLIPGGLKSQWHFRLQQREWLARLIVDIHLTARPALAIMDGIVGMEGMGPSGGQPRKIGALIASADLAAVDTLACLIIGQNLEQVPVLREVRARQAGATRLEELRVAGDDWQALRLPDFKRVEHPEDVLRLLPLPHGLLRWLRAQWTAVPEIQDARCVACGICEKGCPVKPAAIHPEAEGAGRFEPGRCIRCYCCHEFCPVHAIELRQPWLARHLPVERLADWGGRLLGRLQSRPKDGAPGKEPQE